MMPAASVSQIRLQWQHRVIQIKQSPQDIDELYIDLLTWKGCEHDWLRSPVPWPDALYNSMDALAQLLAVGNLSFLAAHAVPCLTADGLVSQHHTCPHRGPPRQSLDAMNLQAPVHSLTDGLTENSLDSLGWAYAAFRSVPG